MIIMAKFIEVTERGDGKKHLLNIDSIVSITEQDNGLAFIELIGSYDCDTIYGIACMELYIDIYNVIMICRCLLIGDYL